MLGPLQYARIVGLVVLASLTGQSASVLAQQPAAEPTTVSAPTAADTGSAASDPTGQSCGSQDFVKQVQKDESGGNYGIENSHGYLGAYQVGEAKLRDLGYVFADGDAYDEVYTWKGKGGVTSKEGFLANKELQDKVFWEVKDHDWKTAKRIGLTKYIGQTLPDGTTITESSILHACHLGCGKVQSYFQNGMVCSGKATGDANKTCVSKYLKTGSGFDVSGLTGGTNASAGTCGRPADEPWNGDTTSRTCPPSVDMVQGIDCGNYPISLLGFCSRYKPLQMNMSECKDAERYAENVPPSGPYVEACKKETFNRGTGSWSYVLACAKAEPAQGETPSGEPRDVGTGNDPACFQRLKDRGAQIDAIGRRDHSVPGHHCIVENEVRYSPKAVKMQATNMNCALAEQFEDFAEAMAGRGVTNIGHVGAINCRGQRGAKGSDSSKTSVHGYGNAIDVSDFTVNGTKIAVGEYARNSQVQGWLRETMQIGCTKFDKVLAWNVYGKSHASIHFEAGSASRKCD